jgi:hypothetical protein
MSKKKSDDSTHLANMLLMAGGLFLLRKLLAAAWTKVTGRVPPTDLTDPKVTLPEALVWGVVTGVVIESARFAVVRGTMRRSPADTDGVQTD